MISSSTTLRPQVAQRVAYFSPSQTLRADCSRGATPRSPGRLRRGGGCRAAGGRPRPGGGSTGWISSEAARRWRSTAARAIQPPRPNRSTTTSPGSSSASIRAATSSGDGGGARRPNAGSENPGCSAWGLLDRPWAASCHRPAVPAVNAQRAGERPTLGDPPFPRSASRDRRPSPTPTPSPPRRPGREPAAAGDGARAFRALRDGVAVAVVGRGRAAPAPGVALLAEGHALIEDVPGVGKTLLARAFARALGLGFGRIQGTPDLLPGDVTGASILESGPAVPVRARPGLHEHPAGGRDQPGHAADAVGTARGDAGAPGVGRGRDPSPAGRRSSCSPPRTRSSTRARSRCPRPSSTGSSCA